MTPPYADLVLSGVSIHAGANLDIFGVKFDSMLTSKDHVRGVVSFSLRELVFCLW